MPLYEYKGLDVNSKNVSGSVEAESEKVARAKLRKQRIYPTKISLSGSKKSGSKFFQSVKVEEIASMTRQLAILLDAKLPLVDALNATLDQIENPLIRKAMTEIKDKVNEGARLADCMQHYPKVFDNIFIHMVRAGEASGALDLVLLRLADFKESQANLKSTIKSAMYYPVIMLVVAVGMLSYLFTSVVPKIAETIAKRNAVLPTPTKIVMSITYAFQEYGLIILVLFAMAVVGFRYWAKTPKGQEALDDFSLRMPVFGELNVKVSVARFARTLSTLLNSGVQLLPGLDIVKNVLDNVVLSKIVDDVMISVKEGESLVEPLRRSGRFPTLFLHMVAVGEKTGQLEAMLERVASTYNNEIDTYVKGMTSLLTPVMLIFMGGAVGFIVFAVLMPILEMSQQ